MRRVLGRKQSMKPADEKVWWDVINHIEEYVSREEVARATDIARARILKMTNGKKAAYTWSGGKDSLVISDLCQSVGITACQLFITELEYPAWRKFLLSNAPPTCEIVNVGFDLDFIAEHDELLFVEGRLEQFWNINIRQKYFKKYIHDKKLDVLILGHRTIDGNVCGKDGMRIHKDSSSLFAPLYDWSHELLFAYLHYNRIELPFIYKWARGFFFGTHLWVERDNYAEVYEIDPSIVIAASKKLLSAKKFLEEIHNAASIRAQTEHETRNGKSLVECDK